LPAWVQMIGRMHTLILHFPIVLILLSIVWELFSGFKTMRSREQADIGDILLLVTALTSV